MCDFNNCSYIFVVGVWCSSSQKHREDECERRREIVPGGYGGSGDTMDQGVGVYVLLGQSHTVFLPNCGGGSSIL